MGNSKHPAPTLLQMEDEPPYPNKIANDDYERQLRDLQIELLKLQKHVKESGEKVVRKYARFETCSSVSVGQAGMDV